MNIYLPHAERRHAEGGNLMKRRNIPSKLVFLLRTFCFVKTLRRCATSTHKCRSQSLYINRKARNIMFTENKTKRAISPKNPRFSFVWSLKQKNKKGAGAAYRRSCTSREGMHGGGCVACRPLGCAPPVRENVG